MSFGGCGLDVLQHHSQSFFFLRLQLHVHSCVNILAPTMCVCVFRSYSSVCTPLCIEANVHALACFFSLSCACVSLRICWTEQVNAGWHMQFTNLLEESRLTAKPSHAGIHGNQKRWCFFSLSLWVGDSKMLKCTNKLSLPSSLILNRVRLFLPAVLIVQRVAYTCNLEIPLVTFFKQKLHINFTCLFPCPQEDTLLKNSSIHGHYLCFCLTCLPFLCSQLSCKIWNGRFQKRIDGPVRLRRRALWNIYDTCHYMCSCLCLVVCMDSGPCRIIDWQVIGRKKTTGWLHNDQKRLPHDSTIYRWNIFYNLSTDLYKTSLQPLTNIYKAHMNLFNINHIYLYIKKFECYCSVHSYI